MSIFYLLASQHFKLRLSIIYKKNSKLLWSREDIKLLWSREDIKTQRSMEIKFMITIYNNIYEQFFCVTAYKYWGKYTIFCVAIFV